MTTRSFAWAHGAGEVQALGGMLGPVRFRLDDGRAVSPLHVAPWADHPQSAALPGVLRRLRGEWPCVPFGHARAGALAGDWAPLAGGPDGQPPHGAGSNTEWTFDDDLTLHLDYPADSPIRRLRRRIRPDPQAPAISVDLAVQARRDVTLPIGLHPTFRVPDAGVQIAVAGGGLTFPGALEPGVSALAEAAAFDSLDAVPLRAGGRVDLGRLPLPCQTEELVQMTAPGGTVTLRYPSEGFSVRMDWDPADFPGLVIWVSNRGRAAYPWSGRHQAVGLEPVCAAFDLGTRISAGHNPLQQAGHPTARTLRAGEVFETTLRLSVTALKPQEDEP